jgi:hypothetical protein
VLSRATGNGSRLREGLWWRGCAVSWKAGKQRAGLHGRRGRLAERKLVPGLLNSRTSQRVRIEGFGQRPGIPFHRLGLHRLQLVTPNAFEFCSPVCVQDRDQSPAAMQTPRNRVHRVSPSGPQRRNGLHVPMLRPNKESCGRRLLLRRKTSREFLCAFAREGTFPTGPRCDGRTRGSAHHSSKASAPKCAVRNTARFAMSHSLAPRPDASRAYGLSYRLPLARSLSVFPRLRDRTGDGAAGRKRSVSGRFLRPSPRWFRRARSAPALA